MQLLKIRPIELLLSNIGYNCICANLPNSKRYDVFYHYRESLACKLYDYHCYKCYSVTKFGGCWFNYLLQKIEYLKQ